VLDTIKDKLDDGSDKVKHSLHHEQRSRLVAPDPVS
jgi:hypothetical protein